MFSQAMTFESLLEECNDLKKRLSHYETYIKNLEEANRLLRHRQFAPRSERFKDTDDQMFFDEIEKLSRESTPDDDEEGEQQELIEVGPHKKRKPKRKKLPPDLPREKITIELSEEQRHCPHDGTELKVVGAQVSERLEVIPMQMKVIETHRLTYACPSCETHMKTAAVQPSIVPKGVAGSGTLAFIATSKFCDGLSLYHIEKMFERNGVEISRGSMAHWMIKVHLMAQPVLNLLEDELLGGGYVQMDETPVQVLKEKGKKPQSLSYMWVRAKLGSRSVVLFDYDPTRSGQVAKRLMESFRGKLQCDGYCGYDDLEKISHIVRCGCMAHVRRKFYEAVKSTKGAHIAKHALKLIQKLYRIEDEVEDKPPDSVLKIRQAKSVPILDELKVFLEENLHRVPPKSATGKALMYLHNEWVYVTRYVEDGRLQIDNNFIENKIRPFAVGRKRWLFSDTVDGANASAALYSLVETAKANGLEPYTYLRHLFEELPKAQTVEDYEKLLPWIIKSQNLPPLH